MKSLLGIRGAGLFRSQWDLVGPFGASEACAEVAAPTCALSALTRTYSGVTPRSREMGEE